MTTAHKHRLSGQTLSHNHEGGDVPHGYYMHPEDPPDLGPEFAGIYEPDHTERDARIFTRTHAEETIIAGADMVSDLSEDGHDAACDMARDAIGRLPIKSNVTYADIASALNAAANDISDEVEGENEDTIRNDSARDLAVNAATHLLTHPDADLYEIITMSWADLDVIEEDLPEGTKKGDDAWNDAIYETVTEWIW